jgi:hypothetical protein
MRPFNDLQGIGQDGHSRAAESATGLPLFHALRSRCSRSSALKQEGRSVHTDGRRRRAGSQRGEHDIVPRGTGYLISPTRGSG